MNNNNNGFSLLPPNVCLPDLNNVPSWVWSPLHTGSLYRLCKEPCSYVLHSGIELLIQDIYDVVVQLHMENQYRFSAKSMRLHNTTYDVRGLCFVITTQQAIPHITHVNALQTISSITNVFVVNQAIRIPSIHSALYRRDCHASAPLTTTLRIRISPTLIPLGISSQIPDDENTLGHGHGHKENDDSNNNNNHIFYLLLSHIFSLSSLTTKLILPPSPPP
jgi:hypothetical protein